MPEAFPLDPRMALSMGPARPSTIAFDGTQFLVVLEAYDTITGRIVAADGQVGAEFLLATGDSADVASDGSAFFAVWRGRCADMAVGVCGQAVDVDASGNVTIGSPLLTIPSAEGQPAVAFGTSKYLVTWTYQGDIWGVPVDPVAGPAGPYVPISTAPGQQVSSSVAFGSNSFLVVFADSRNGGWEIAGSRVTEGGYLLDGDARSGGFTIAGQDASGSRRDPKVAFKDKEWLVVWAYAAIHGARIDLFGHVADQFVSGAGPSFSAHVTAGSRAYFVTWQVFHGERPPTGAYYDNLGQLLGVKKLWTVLRVNSTADPGDGVCDDAQCTLREAVGAANHIPGPNEIDVPAGHYVLVAGELEIADPLVLRGAGRAVAIVDADGRDRVFHVAAPVQVKITGVTIRNGWSGDGGGIRNDGGTLELLECAVVDNRVTLLLGESQGAGIFNSGVLYIGKSVISRNSSVPFHSSRGGGVYNTGTGSVWLGGSTISYNQSQTASAIYNQGKLLSHGTVFEGNESDDERYGGQAIDNWGEATFERATFINNWAGAVLSNTGNLALRDSTVRGTAQMFAGGILSNSGFLELSGSTLSGNSSPVVANGGVAHLRNCTVSGNWSAQPVRGAIGNSGSMTITNCTIAQNRVPGLENTGTLELASSIVAGNDRDCLGAITSLGYNIDGDGSCGLAGVGDLTADPLLGPLRANGGPAPTHALLPGSPAIDQIPGADCRVSTDQRGVGRPQGDGCDVGAYEAAPRRAK